MSAAADITLRHIGPDRFWRKVTVTPECWIWRAHCGPNGYGRFWTGTTMGYAHRWAYEFFVGPIPEGLELDHLCRNRACVNPSHLEPVTKKTNIMRGVSLPAQNAIKTHCLRGHEFTPENTLVPLPGRRRCKTCVNDRRRRTGKWS